MSINIDGNLRYNQSKQDSILLTQVDIIFLGLLSFRLERNAVHGHQHYAEHYDKSHCPAAADITTAAHILYRSQVLK